MVFSSKITMNMQGNPGPKIGVDRTVLTKGSIVMKAALVHTGSNDMRKCRIPVAVSARHAHLSQVTLDRLFGANYQLHVRSPLSQTGQFAAEETVNLIGPRGRIDHVRVLGPCRAEDQIEISRSDEVILGIDAPIRESGDVRSSPGITLEVAERKVTLSQGVICAWRHIHMNAGQARQFGVRDHDKVHVSIHSDARSLEFSDVIVRVDPSFSLELHLDTDEANAAGISPLADHAHAGECVTASIIKQA